LRWREAGIAFPQRTQASSGQLRITTLDLTSSPSSYMLTTAGLVEIQGKIEQSDAPQHEMDSSVLDPLQGHGGGAMRWLGFFVVMGLALSVVRRQDWPGWLQVVVAILVNLVAGAVILGSEEQKQTEEEK